MSTMTTLHAWLLLGAGVAIGFVLRGLFGFLGEDDPDDCRCPPGGLCRYSVDAHMTERWLP